MGFRGIFLLSQNVGTEWHQSVPFPLSALGALVFHVPAVWFATELWCEWLKSRATILDKIGP